jgi:hypothetical protein
MEGMSKYRSQRVPESLDIGQAPSPLPEIIPNVLFRGYGDIVTTSRFTDG